MLRTDRVQTEGADLVFDVRGGGAPLLLIPGAGGEGSAFGSVADSLSDRHTVITYDRRCNGRSSGDATATLDVAQQARDAVAVLAAAGHQAARIFGTSGGGNIALQLAAEHPRVVQQLILHEPATVCLLRGADDVSVFIDQVHRTFETHGAPAAMMTFASRLVGVDFSKGPPGGRAPKDMSFFFAKEYLNITLFEPDLATIRSAGTPVVVLVGKDSGEAYYVVAARAVAEELACPLVTVPGNHLAFVIDPVAFADALGKALV